MVVEGKLLRRPLKDWRRSRYHAVHLCPEPEQASIATLALRIYPDLSSGRAEYSRADAKLLPQDVDSGDGENLCEPTPAQAVGRLVPE